MRDVVILLPGIMGSVLQRHGKDVWAISGTAISRALITTGGSIADLFLAADDPSVNDLGDGVKATRVFPDAHIVPGFVRIDGYSRIKQMIMDEFDVQDGAFTEHVPGDIRLDRPGTFFEFPYDWRRDNRASARRLKQLAEQALVERRKTVPDAKLVLLAHSMGGLVSRYYLECLDGWKDCRTLVTFGTPYRGAVQTIDYLANGFRKMVELKMVSDMARSFTSMYQLLPIYKALKTGDEWRRVAETEGVPNIDRERSAQALAFHREIEKAVEQRRSTAEGAAAYTLIPFVGTAQETLLSAEIQGGKITTSRNAPAWIAPEFGVGDGTVPQVSAIPIEMEGIVETYLAARHGSLQQHTQVLEDLRHRLARVQTPGLAAIRGPGPAQEPSRPDLSLDVDDFFLREEPVLVQARIKGASTPPQDIVATVSRADGPGTQLKLRMEEHDGQWRGEIAGLEPGLYRVEVRTRPGGPSAALPVHELFEVSD